MIFAVLDSSPLTVCINCSSFTFIVLEAEYSVRVVKLHACNYTHGWREDELLVIAVVVDCSVKFIFVDDILVDHVIADDVIACDVIKHVTLVNCWPHHETAASTVIELKASCSVSNVVYSSDERKPVDDTILHFKVSLFAYWNLSLRCNKHHHQHAIFTGRIAATASDSGL